MIEIYFLKIRIGKKLLECYQLFFEKKNVVNDHFTTIYIYTL